MWEKIIELVSQYGQFPVGIIIGILIRGWSDSKLFKFQNKELKAIRQEKKELIELLKIKDLRINELHKQLSNQKGKER